MFGEISGTHRVIPGNPFTGQSVLAAPVDIHAQTQAVFVDTGFFVSLPVAGTYLILLNARTYVVPGSQDSLFIVTQIYQTDTGTAVVVPNSARFGAYVDAADLLNAQANVYLKSVALHSHNAYSYIVNVVAACKIRLYSKWDGGGSAVATAAAVESDFNGYTTFSYMKIG